jgi:hypothetical protein
MRPRMGQGVCAATAAYTLYAKGPAALLQRSLRGALSL